ncbi:hypothetical protein [Flavobacterium sp.]|uniref:hypothetical protein n=1 Tax=Flavobacterium sp. TaxID=239 RepID=UPI0026257229|nr:hypothetical protein [Flavobacterium sp.]
MRTILYLFLIILVVGCKTKKPLNTTTETAILVEEKSRFEKIDLKDVNNQKMTRAYTLGRRLLDACNSSRFKVFTKEEATDKVIQNATVEKITKTCQKILVRNGKFIDLQLLEVTQDNETQDLFFRYKINFEKKYFERELYVTINSEGKVSEMKTKELPKKPM